MGNSLSLKLIDELKYYLEQEKIFNLDYGEASIYQHRITPHPIAIY